MRNYLCLVLCLFSLYFSTAQTVNPVKWTFTAKKINADSIELRATAIIAKSWHIYSLYNEGGPGPTSFNFDRNSLLRLRGDTRELASPILVHEPLFDVDVREFSSKADFVQLVQRKRRKSTFFTGKVKYIACNGNHCMPPKEEKFSVAVD